VNYTGAAQAIKISTGTPSTYYNLTLSGTGAKTFGAITAISGNLAITATAAAATLVAFNCTSATVQLGGVYQVSETYGRVGSSATNQSAYFGGTGAGFLTVSSGCVAGQWTGATSTDWATTSNWCSGTLPISSTDVTIPSGTLFQPTISAIGAQCKNITISSGATLTMSGTGALTVSGNWSNSGTLTAGTGTVTFNNSPAAAQTITGTTLFNNLTINNTAGVSLASEGVGVNDILTLQSANASASQGTLHTGIYTLLITNEAASTTGTGDVSGTIKRTHTFNPNTPYTFGSQYTTLDFINTGTQPNEISCKIVLGSILPLKTGSVLRYYSFAQTGGTTGTDQVIVNLRFLSAEINGNTGSKLVLWDQHLNTSVEEHGKTNFDLVNNWVGLSGLSLTYLAPTTIDNKKWGLGDNTAAKNTWQGINTAWEDVANWSAGHIPGSADNLADNVLIPASKTNYPVLSADREVATVEIEAIGTGATPSISAGTYNITVNGYNSAWVNHGTFIPGTGKVIFSHSTSGHVVALDGTTDFYNIETSNANTYLQPSTGNTMKIAGNITQTAGIIDLIATTNTVEYTGTTSRTIINPVGPGTDKGYHNLIISTTGGGTITFPTTLNIAGDFTNNGTVSSGTGTVIMKDNEHLQNIGGTTSTTFYNLTIDNTNQSVLVNSPITVSNVLTVNSLTTMDMVTNALSGVTSTSGTGSFKTQNTSSTPIPSGKTWSFDADYNGAGQTVMAGTYANLALSASGTKTAAGELSVTGALAVASGITLDMVTYALSGEATNSGTGTLKTQNTSSTPIPAGKTWGFGLVEYNGAGQTVIDGTYTDLTLSGSGTKTLPASSTTIGGNFTQSGTAAASGAAGAMSLSGNFTNSSSGSFAPSAGTFTFGGTSAQTISGTGAIAFSGLTINNAAGVTGSCDISVSGELYLQSANASDVKGALDMASSKKLSLGIDATTTGTGDVTGIVRRAHTFTASIDYTFNHHFTTIRFASGGTVYPTALECKVSIGTAPSWKTGAIKRIDDYIQEAGNGTSNCYVTFASHYLDSELNGNNEERLVRFKYINPNITENGRSAMSIVDNWVANSNIQVSSKINTTYGWERTYANSEASTLVWTGSTNADFSNQNNWTPNSTPISTSNIVIPDVSLGSNLYPSLTAPTTINSMSIENGGTLNSGTYTLTIAGTTSAWINMGTFNAETGTVVFTGNGADLSGTTDFYNLTINAVGRLNAQDGSVTGIAGAVTNSGIWSTVSSGITTVNYNGGDQAVVIPDASTNRYYNLILSGSGTKTLPATPFTVLGDLIMSGTATATETSTLTVHGNATIDSYNVLNIGTTGAVTITGTLSNNGGEAGLVIKSTIDGTGSLIHSTSGIGGTVERFMSNADWVDGQDGWHFLGSPVAAQAIAPGFTVGSGSDVYDFYAWHEPLNLWVNIKNTTTAPTWSTVNGGSDNFIVGKGYMAAYDVEGTKSFSGSLNIADVPVSGLTSAGTTQYGQYFNLLGNPFASAITWDASSVWVLNHINGVAKIWDESFKGYRDLTSSPATVIPATNGFMVQVATGTTGSLTIPASKRVHSSQAFYKSTIPGIKLIARNVTADNAQESSLFINPEATTGFDMMLDGEYLAGYGPTFYSMAGDVRLSTNSLPDLSAETSVPYTFSPNSGTSYKIEAAGLETMMATTWLLDKKTGTDHNLTTTPSYSFTSVTGDDPNRFLLHFSGVGVNESAAAVMPVDVYTTGNTIVVSSNTGKAIEGDALVYNMIGQLVMKQHVGLNLVTRLSLTGKTGYYVVKVITENQAYTEKVFINW
jgi:hypothetical protein